MAKYGSGTVYKRGDTWWIKGPGVKPQSAKTADKKQAQATLKVRLAEALQGKQTGSERVTVSDILHLVLEKYRTEERKSTQNVEISIAHMTPVFGNVRMADLTTAHLERFRKARRAAGVAGTTVNRDLAVLRHGITLAMRRTPPLVVRQIFIKMDPEDKNTRQGFLDDSDYEKLRDALPEYLRPLFVCCYETGVRRSEMTSILWKNVDFEREVMLAYETKNSTPHVIPFIGDMREYLKKAQATAIPSCPYVFQHMFTPKGKAPRAARIQTFYKVWKVALKAIDREGLLFHDLRRTAGRRFEDVGISRGVGMKILGHKTEIMYRRYASVSNMRDIKAGVAKVEADRESKKMQNKAGPISLITIYYERG